MKKTHSTPRPHRAAGAASRSSARRTVREVALPVSAPAWSRLFEGVATRQAVAIRQKGPSVPVHRILSEASAFAWEASASEGSDGWRFSFRKVGRRFSFSAGTVHSGVVAAFPAVGSIYLVVLRSPQKIGIELETGAGRILNLSCPGRQLAFEVASEDTQTRVLTDPTTFLPGGYRIFAKTSESDATITVRGIQAIPASAEEHAETLPPDQFRRFKAAGIAAELIAGPSGSYLDIGAGDGGLSAFLPEVLTLDTRFLDRAGHLTRPLLARRLPKCDVALLIDTLEHIPAAERASALAAVCRSARRGVVICAPFDSDARRDAETLVRRMCRHWALDHAHLDEHRKYGLPDLAGTLRTLKRQGFNCTILRIQPLNQWALLSALTAHLDRDPQFTPIRDALFRVVNEQFPIGARELREDCYEELIVASRQELSEGAVAELRSRIEVAPTPSGVPPQTSLPLLLDALLQDKIIEKDREIARLSAERDRQEAALRALAEDQAARISLGESVQVQLSAVMKDRDNWHALYMRSEKDGAEKVAHITAIEAAISSLRQSEQARVAEEKHLRKELDSVIVDRDNHRRLFQTAESDRLEKIAHIKTIEAELATLNQDRQSRAAEYARLRDELDSVIKDRDNRSQLLQTTESDRLQKIGHITAIEAELASLHLDQQSRAAESARLRDELDSVIKDRDNRIRLLQDAEDERLKRIAQVNTLEAELTSLRLDQQSRIAEDARLRGELESVIKDRENRNQLLQTAEVDRLEKIAHIKAIEGELSSLHLDQQSRIAEDARLRSELDSVVKDRENRNQLLQTAEADRLEKIAHIKAIEAEIASLRLDQQSRTAENARLRDELDSVIKDRENRNRLLQDAEAELNLLRKDQLASATERARVRLELDSALKTGDSLRAASKEREKTLLDELDGLQAERKGIAERLEKAESSRKEKVQYIELLASQIVYLQEAVNRGAEDLATARAAEERAQSQLVKTVEEIGGWKALSSQERAQRLQLEEKLQEAVEEIGGLRSNLDAARERYAEELATSRAKEVRVQSELVRAAEEIGGLRAKLDAAQDRNTELERQSDARLAEAQAASELRVSEIRGEKARVEVQLAERESAHREAVARLERKEAHARQLEGLLNEIWRSRTWRILRSVDRLLGRGPAGGRTERTTGTATGTDANAGAASDEEPGEVPGGSLRAAGGLRILQAVHFFLPRHCAGVEVYTAQLCKQLLRSNDVGVLHAEHNLTVPQYTLVDGEYEGIRCREITNNYHHDDFRQTYRDPKIDSIFGEMLDGFRPDIVHIQHLLNLSVGIIGEAKKRRIPVVYTLHDYWLTCPTGGQRFRDGSTVCEAIDPGTCDTCFRKSHFNTGRLGGGDDGGLVPRITERLDKIRAALQDVDLFIAPSRFIHDRFVDFGVPDEKIIWLPYGHAPLTPVPRVRSDSFRVGYVGTLVPHKGVHILLDALRELGDGNRVQLTICGDTSLFPDYVDELRRKSAGLPVEFCGRVSMESLPYRLAEIDVLVVPSLWWENWPLTVNEAFMAGVPVVASAIGGLPELVRTGENGLLFQPGSASDLAEKIAMLRDNPELLAHLQQGVPRVKTMAEHAAELLVHYRSLIERGRR